MYKHIVVLVTALCSITAFAGEDTAIKAATANSPSTTHTFESLDKNGDLQISRTEAGADKKLSNIFVTADTNGDGYVDKDEFLSRPLD